MKYTTFGFVILEAALKYNKEWKDSEVHRDVAEWLRQAGVRWKREEKVKKTVGCISHYANFDFTSVFIVFLCFCFLLEALQQYRV